MVGDLMGVYALGSEMKCPICGKFFLRKDMDWAYQRFNGKTTVFFCSWGCLRRYEKKHPKRDCVGHGTYGG